MNDQFRVQHVLSLTADCRLAIHLLLTLTCNIVHRDLSMKRITTLLLLPTTNRQTLQTFGMPSVIVFVSDRFCLRLHIIAETLLGWLGDRKGIQTVKS